MNTCRVCGNKYFKDPLLKYENMPKVAQNLPDEKSLINDQGVLLEVYQCSGCGLIQLSNDPVPYYRDVIRAAAFSPEMKGFRIKQFQNFIQQYSLLGKKIIEIGCGRGEYLEIMQQFDVQTFGIEHLDESVKYCNNKGLKVSQGFIDNTNYIVNHAPFDVFYILNFFEHLPDPCSTLRGIYNNLTDNAIGLIEVPNSDMIFRNKLFSEFTADHLLYFTKDTLNSVLTLNGFETVECKEIWYDYIISAVVKKKKKLEISHFYEYQKQLQTQIESFISNFGNNKVAIWGAGHQAFANISMLKLTGKIKYVVDSAPFKQGKYTPATHIKIVSPDMLDIDPVDAIIVMAASYSDEVAKIIKNKYNNRISVTIFRDYGLEKI